jgi:hypothetical protein
MAAWVLEGEETSGLVGRVITPGEPSSQSSYRSELAGIFAVMFVISKFIQFHNVSQGLVHMACNSESALDKVSANANHLSTDEPSYDLICAIQKLKSSIPIQWKFIGTRPGSCLPDWKP